MPDPETEPLLEPIQLQPVRQERSTPRLFTRLLVVGIAGGLTIQACNAVEGKDSQKVETEDRQGQYIDPPPSHDPQHFVEIGGEWEGITTAVRNIPFLSTPQEVYDVAYEPEKAEAFLKSHGIGWSLTKKGFENVDPDDYFYSAGDDPSTTIVDLLGRMPCGPIKLSELKHIDYTYTRNDVNSGDYYIPSKSDMKNGIARISSEYQLPELIGAMILDKLPEKDQIIADYTRITEQAGETYEAGYWDKVKNSYDRPGRKFDSIFITDQAKESPALDFAINFGEILKPEGDVSWPLHNLDYPKTQKLQLAVDTFTRLVPGGLELLKLRSYEFEFGTRGLSPLDNLGRVFVLSKALNRATTREQQKKILDEDENSAKYVTRGRQLQTIPPKTC